jgi:hypothetical protein
MTGFTSKPCENCPFLKEGYIDLMPGRVRGIVDFLMQSDFHGFPCHKTTDGGTNTHGRKVKECAGAIVYRLKAGRPSVYMRVGMMTGSINPTRMMRLAPRIIDHPYRGKR